MYLLDTNHCTYAIERHPDVLGRLVAIGDTPITTSVIVHAEFWYMVHRSQRVAENRYAVAQFLAEIDTFPIEESIAQQYGLLKVAVFERFGPRERARQRRTTLT